MNHHHVNMVSNNVAGISDNCNNKGISQFTTLLSDWSGSQGHCMYVHAVSVV